MKAADIRPDRPDTLYMAVGILLEGQQATHEALVTLQNAVADVKADVAAVKVDTAKTNGRVNKHDSDLADIEAGMEKIEERQCPAPGSCSALGDRVRKLEEERIRKEGVVEGVTLSWRFVNWLIGGGIIGAIGAILKFAGII